MLMEDVRKVRTEMDEQSGVGGQIRESGPRTSGGSCDTLGNERIVLLKADSFAGRDQGLGPHTARPCAKSMMMIPSVSCKCCSKQADKVPRALVPEGRYLLCYSKK